VAVPGWWAAFEAAHTRFATRSLAEVMAPAIAVATDGFAVHPHLYGYMFEMSALLGRTADGREMYFRDGGLLPPGATVRQPKAARVLTRLAEDGSDYFYRGEFARRFCEVVGEAGGVITPEDFEAYDVRWPEPARGTYRGYDVVTQPPPDAGSLLIEVLNILELVDIKAQGPYFASADTLYQMMLVTEYVKGAVHDQRDPKGHPLPLELLLSKDYARVRWELLQMGTPKPQPSALPGTNHITVVDQDGNIATMKHSCMALPWQNGLFVDGISICAGGGHFVGSVPLPGHRANVYGATNIIFRDGQPVLASGSPGVGLLQCVVANTSNILDFGMSVEDSVHQPRFGSRYLGAQMVEVDLDESLRKEVVARGLDVDVVAPWQAHLGSFEGVFRDDDGRLHACADPRRTGQAVGL
jgi:gamma-glutamyltranspeptidase/glutathione hydrolase